jgi:hypothetical protein
VGFRLEESQLSGSVVAAVRANGPGDSRGVTVGCAVVGINYERHISFAHSVTALVHANRPLTIRFNAPAASSTAGALAPVSAATISPAV